MSLKKIMYTDPDGRKKLVLLPEEENEENAELGILVGPPNLSELELPTDIEIALNNELFNRGIFTPFDATSRRQEVLASLTSIFKLSTEKIVTLYTGKGIADGLTKFTEEQPDTTLQHRRRRQSA